MPRQPRAVTQVARIDASIIELRGQRVLLDEALSELYGVPTKVLLQSVKRNHDRFPRDFMFQLTRQELANLRSQIVTSSLGHGGRRFSPYAFTEQGVAMLSSVLRSSQAVQVNIEIMRAFVRLRGFLASNRALAGKLDELEKKVSTHDQAIAGILTAIRELMKPVESPRRPIGFVRPEK